MDTIVGSKTESVVVDSENTSVVISPTTELVSQESTKIELVVVQIDNTSTVVSGQPGPEGPMGQSEDNMVYAKQTDFVGDDVIYKGEATVGTTTSASLWRIRKIVLGVDGDVSETWADGNANFDNVWDDRVSLSYT